MGNFMYQCCHFMYLLPFPLRSALFCDSTKLYGVPTLLLTATYQGHRGVSVSVVCRRGVHSDFMSPCMDFDLFHGFSTKFISSIYEISPVFGRIFFFILSMIYGNSISSKRTVTQNMRPPNFQAL
jgi:hypothetical protein